MDQHSAVIEQEMPLGYEAPAVATFQVPVAAQAPVNEQTADLELCRMAATGNIAAFELIYERYHRRTYSLCLRMTSSQTEAEDLTQEVFLRFHLAQARFDASNLIRPWLLGIARNLLREHVRSLRRRKEVAWTELCLELETVLPLDPHSADDALTHLPVCLENLGPSARQAIELKYRSEQKLADIGKQLHRSEGAVKLLVHRARQALRDCLDQKSKAASRT